MMSLKLSGAILAAAALTSIAHTAVAQTEAPPEFLTLLAPVSALCGGESDKQTKACSNHAGEPALKANLAITAAIQQGKSAVPGVQSFLQQQQQALRDAFITGDDASQLADGLGKKLGEAYRTAAHYEDKHDGKAPQSVILWQSVETVLKFASKKTGDDAGLAKYVFGNMRRNKSDPAPSSYLKVFDDAQGTADFFGRAYREPAGAAEASRFGNSRPFLTEPKFLKIIGYDYFETPSNSMRYLYGPDQPLVDSPSYPSGHTTYGYTESLVLALLVPERYEQMMTRGAEYGNSRIVLGAHYTMDVIGGRTLALYDMAHILASDAAEVGSSKETFQAALEEARKELRAALEAACGDTIARCASDPAVNPKDAIATRFADSARNMKFSEATQTYGLPVVYRDQANKVEDVGALAPEAGWLLRAAFPKLSLEDAQAILTETEGPGGGFLDNGGKLGVYSRIDLYRAVERAKEKLGR